MTADHNTFMAMAIEQAKAAAAGGDQPFGAVVVRNGEVVCHNRNDSSHARRAIERG